MSPEASLAKIAERLSALRVKRRRLDAVTRERASLIKEVARLTDELARIACGPAPRRTGHPDDPPFDAGMSSPITSLGLSARTERRITNAGVSTVGDLVDRIEAAIGDKRPWWSQFEHFSIIDANDLISSLGSRGVRTDMMMDHLPPDGRGAHWRAKRNGKV